MGIIERLGRLSNLVYINIAYFYRPNNLDYRDL